MSEDRPPTTFILKRQSDGLVYHFDRTPGPDGQVGFKRRDGDHWIIWHDDLRWIAGAWGSDDVYGRPWDQLVTQSRSAPPEGIWVSRKGPKSYVYDLIYAPET